MSPPALACAQVTKKDKEQDTQWASFKKALSVTWPHLLYLVAFISGIIYFIVTAAKGWYRRGWERVCVCAGGVGGGVGGMVHLLVGEALAGSPGRLLSCSPPPPPAPPKNLPPVLRTLHLQRVANHDLPVCHRVGHAHRALHLARDLHHAPPVRPRQGIALPCPAEPAAGAV